MRNKEQKTYLNSLLLENRLVNKENSYRLQRSDKYTLIYSEMSPLSHDSLIVHKLMKLENIIALEKVNTNFNFKNGWELSNEKDKYVSNYYTSYPTTVQSVPLLMETRTNKIITNNYLKLTNYFEEELHDESSINLYPSDMREVIDEFNNWLFNSLVIPIYRAGFPESQSAYEFNYQIVFNTLDILEERLSKSRYLFGNKITDSDVKLYTILIRFDEAYFMLYKVNKKLIRDFANLTNYVKDLYQIPAFGSTTNFDAIKEGYYTAWSPYSFNEGDANAPSQPVRKIPLGPDNSLWSKPHNRDLFI